MGTDLWSWGWSWGWSWMVGESIAADKFLPSLRDNEIMDDLFEAVVVLPKALYRTIAAPVVRRMRNRQHNGSGK